MSGLMSYIVFYNFHWLVIFFALISIIIGTRYKQFIRWHNRTLRELKRSSLLLIEIIQ